MLGGARPHKLEQKVDWLPGTSGGRNWRYLGYVTSSFYKRYYRSGPSFKWVTAITVNACARQSGQLAKTRDFRKKA